MTEQEWLKLESPSSAIFFVHTMVSARKLTLLAVASARRVSHLMDDERSRQAVEVAERYADRAAKRGELTAAQQAAHAAEPDRIRQHGGDQQAFWAQQAAGLARRAALGATKPTLCRRGQPTCDAICAEGIEALRGWAREHSAESFPESRSVQNLPYFNLLSCIFGNPFRPITFVPEWRSDTALSLAKHIYEARDFTQMPILADALQDARCDNADVLNHCRDPQQVHVRGCWALDLVLGKE